MFSQTWTARTTRFSIGPMRLRTRDGCRLGILFALVSMAGCRDEPAFVSLPKLCEARAADVCDARAHCCDPEDAAACLASEAAACEQVRAQLEAEPLSYDARAATHTLDAQNAQLDACGAVPDLASLFSGGLALGAACARGTQCASGSCAGTPAACVAATARPLCSAR